MGRVARNGRDTSGAGPWSTTLPAGARSATFTRLRAWDSYALSVQAINRVGPGPVVTRWVTITDPRPSAPTSVTAVPGDAEVTVTWRAPMNLTDSVTGYRIRSYPVPGDTAQSSVTVPASARRAVVTGLTNGRAYRFDVTALNRAGAGVPSGRTPAVTP